MIFACGAKASLLATDFMAVGIFQAIGKGSYSLIFAILRKVVLEIPALYILNYFFPLYGLAFAQSSAEIVLAVAAVVVMSGGVDSSVAAYLMLRQGYECTGVTMRLGTLVR